MWQIIPSLATLLQDLAPAFTEPSCRTQAEVLLGLADVLGPPHRVSRLRSH